MNTLFKISIYLSAYLIWDLCLIFAEFRTWTHTNGNTFVAQCSDFDYPLVYLKSKAGRIYEIDVDDLREKDRVFLWTVYSKDRVLKLLNDWEERLVSEGQKSLFSESDRFNLLTVVEHLRYRALPLELIYGTEGSYKASNHLLDRLHSGMLYYAIDSLNSMRSFLEDPRTDIAKYSVVRELEQFRYFEELIETLRKQESYTSGRLGQQFPVKFKSDEHEDFRQPYHYYAYIPKSYQSEKRLPCLIWLPGEGEYGLDIRALLKWDLPKRLSKDVNYPFIVISVGHGNALMQVDYLNAIYADVIKRFKIDPDRVIATGMSSGASAAWRWACRHPELFAAIVPISGIMPHFEMQRLTELPIWLFNNELDNIWIQKLAIEFFKTRNQSFNYTLYKNAKGHDAWTKAYNDTQLLEWMLKQKRNKQPHPSNPIKALEIKNQLSKAVIKELRSYDILALALDPMDRLHKKASVKNTYYFQKGLSETFDTTRAVDTLLQFFRDKPDGITGPLVQVIEPNSKDLYFGFPAKDLPRSAINKPFEREHLKPMRAYCAYYYGKKLNTSVPLKMLRNRAIKAGHSLTGRDRILYHQLMTPEQYVFEIQLGIKTPQKDISAL